ncbi:MAG: hypothetical protein K2L87_01350 [Clostridiales bacterium]|nr:hypothetical protein [Clostridiales bacterium]
MNLFWKNKFIEEIIFYAELRKLSLCNNRQEAKGFWQIGARSGGKPSSRNIIENKSKPSGAARCGGGGLFFCSSNAHFVALQDSGKKIKKIRRDIVENFLRKCYTVL